MQRDFAYRWLALLPLTAFAVGCGSDSPAPSGAAGSSAQAGSSSSISGSNQGGAANPAGGATAASGSAEGGSSDVAGAPTSGGGDATTAAGAGVGAGGSSAGSTATGGGSSGGGQGGSAGASAVGGSTASGGSAGAGGRTHTGPWKIMPLGDSITGYCYPQNLAGELAAGGFDSSKVNFVGTVTNNQSCNSPTVATLKTEGHGCYLVTYLERDISTVAGCDGTKGTLSELKTWAAEKPDVVLMEIGTNDVWGATAQSSITDAYSFVVDHFRAENPNVIFFIAQITPMNPGTSSGGKVTISCPDCEGRVESLNAAIPGWASGKSSAASPIYVVNVWSAIDKTTYLPGSSFTADGVHPMPPAAKAMADKWYAALTAHGIP